MPALTNAMTAANAKNADWDKVSESAIFISAYFRVKSLENEGFGRLSQARGWVSEVSSGYFECKKLRFRFRIKEIAFEEFDGEVEMRERDPFLKAGFGIGMVRKR